MRVHTAPLDTIWFWMSSSTTWKGGGGLGVVLDEVRAVGCVLITASLLGPTFSRFLSLNLILLVYSSKFVPGIVNQNALKQLRSRLVAH
jgi:hypothetical protein